MKNTQEKKCAMCGSILSDARKRYCPSCLKKKRRYEYKKPKQTRRVYVIKRPTPVKIDTTQCRTCLYRYGTNTIVCGYVEDVGHSRNCEPSPNCTAYVKGTPIQRAEIHRKRHALSSVYESSDEYTSYLCERTGGKR